MGQDRTDYPFFASLADGGAPLGVRVWTTQRPPPGPGTKIELNWSKRPSGWVSKAMDWAKLSPVHVDMNFA